MEKISVTITKYLQNCESVRSDNKEKTNAEKEVNRAMAGFKKNGTYTAENADLVLELMNKLKEWQLSFEKSSTYGEQLKQMIIEYLIILSGAVDYHKEDHSVINFSLNEHNELIIHPN